MPRFEPFAALRYSPELDLADVTAPPYDVLSDADAEQFKSRHQANIVVVDVPDRRDGDRRYEVAAEQLRRWIVDGTLVRDPEPTLTIYRMNFTDEAGSPRHTIGVIGALEIVDEGAGGVLPHERTTPKASTDRLDLTRATHANLSPVWALSLTPGLTDLLREPAEELGRFVDDDGVEHIVERVSDPSRVEKIAAAIAGNTALIADGHHRYGISRTFRDETRAASGPTSGAELTLSYVAELVEDQLSIDAIHRLYTGLPAEELLGVLAASFTTEEAGPVDARFATEVVARGALCLVRPDGTGVWLTPRPDVLGNVRPLDGEYLEHALAGSQVEVTYQHGVGEVLSALASGGFDAAVLIRPTSIEEIRRTADERLLMPPKSTFFTPKLRTGLVLRPLDL